MDVYYALPAAFRHKAASARGLYLNWWRYGSDTDALVERALARETWSEEQWEEWRKARLRDLLDRAVAEVPHYRALWHPSDRPGEKPWRDLRNWPILTKDEVREDPTRFVAQDRDRRRLFKLSTSGTSGKPLTLWRGRRTSKRWHALFEARWRCWYGVSRRDRWAILGGQIVTPVAQTCPPFWVWNGSMRQLYMSTFHLSPDTTKAYLDALRQYEVKYLWGYASSMNALAQNVLELGLEAPRLDVAISNAEALQPHHRAAIEAAFGCPARNTYGMAEMVAGGSECEAGELHMWPDAGIVEVLDDDGMPVPRGEAGRFVCTGLINDDMPLIRYEVGDRGALACDGDDCACGRRLPRFARIEGRSTDSLHTRDGRRIFWLNPVFYDLRLKEAQIVQNSLDEIDVRVVPAPGYSAADRAAILDRLAARVRDVAVRIHEVDEIPRGDNGKFRSVISLVADRDRVGDDRMTGVPVDEDRAAAG